MARLTAAQRNRLASSQFAGPDRTYPIPDASHARNALARAAQNASAGQQEKIAAKVHKRYPGVGKDSKARKAKIAMFVKGNRG